MFAGLKMFLPLVLKAIMGKDVKEDCKKQGLDGRPAWLSRRALAIATGAGSLLISSLFGIEVPAEAGAQVIEVVDSLYKVFVQVQTILMENKELFITAWSGILGVWGFIRRSK